MRSRIPITGLFFAKKLTFVVAILKEALIKDLLGSPRIPPSKDFWRKYL